MGSATEQPAKAKPETIGIFWKTCVCLAAKGASPFANDWQWFFGFPVWTWLSGTTVFAGLVGNGTGMITGRPWIDALIAGVAAFFITWGFAFVSRVFTVAAERFNEQKSRADALGSAISDAELQTAHTMAMEDHTRAIREQNDLARRALVVERGAGEISPGMQIISHYERVIDNLGTQDKVLSSLVSQYAELRHGLEVIEAFSGPKISERLAAAEHILRELQVVRSATINPNHPTKPLIIKTGHNMFRVTFGVPMRIPPGLTFQGLPDGSTGNVIEKSALGFTVVFSPANIPVGEFRFAADARL